MAKVLMIDPPSGWKYGFPKPAPKDHHLNEVLSAWLLEQGYPEKDIELALKYSRYWESSEVPAENTIQLDPNDREWEYDGDGQKVYKNTRNVFE